MRFIYRLAALVAGIVVLTVSLGLGVNAQVITVPGDITVECGGSIAPEATGIATASDGCNSDPISVESSDDLSGLSECGNTGTITRTWIATDGCSTSITDVQVITVEDNTPPSIACPADMSLACGENPPAVDINAVSAVDDCSGSNVTVAFVDDQVSVNGTMVSTLRTYSATDECGNVATCVQVFEADCTGELFISDPCTCGNPNNYQLGGLNYIAELATIGSGAGETWTFDASAFGIYDSNGNPMTSGTAVEVMPGIYEFPFWVLNSTPYQIALNNGTDVAQYAGFDGDCVCDGAFYDGSVYVDTDGNGSQSSDENGLPGVTVSLMAAGPDGVIGTADDVMLDSTTTNVVGEFNLLVPAPGSDYYLNYSGLSGASYPTLTDAGNTGLLNIGSDGGTAGATPAVLDCASLILDATVVCGSDDAFFTVVVNVVNGQAPYTVSDGFTGFFGSNSFILGPLPNGSSYGFTVTDNAGCAASSDSGGQVDCATVAVDLVSFDGIVQETANQLKWSTASETTDRFLLERSDDANNFQVIATVTAVGSESQGSNYTYVDANAPQRGVTYYRLSEVDLNGQVHVISSVIELRRDVDAVKIDYVAPIPASSELNIGLTGPEGSSAVVTVFNIVGQNVYQTIETLRENGSQVQVDVSELPVGVYILQISNGEFQAVKEFVVTD